MGKQLGTLRRRGVHVVLPWLVAAPFAVAAAGCQRDATAGAISAVTPASGLAVGPDGDLIVARGGLWRSTDGGQSWRPLQVPREQHPDTLRHVATTPAAPQSVFAGGAGAGVLRSDDGGQTWRAIGSALPSQQVAAVAVHSFRPDTVYAAVGGKGKETGGIFRTEDGGGRWQKMDDGPPAAFVALTHSLLEGSMNTGWLYASTPEGPYLSMDCF